MATETIHTTYDFDAPVERLYQHLSVHENLKDLFGIDVEQVKEGETEPYGVGSVRRLSVKGVMPFEETVTLAEPNERIEYTITKGTPLDEHLGVMVFSSTPDGGSHLDYTITIGAKVPGLAKVVGAGLRSGIKRGYPKVAAKLAA
jgi:uncharacterized protein YndB with AHSA1/START domain